MGFTGVKVFSATKAREREELGENVTRWMAAHPGVRVTDKIETQSSDREFHYLTITLFYRHEDAERPIDAIQFDPFASPWIPMTARGSGPAFSRQNTVIPSAVPPTSIRHPSEENALVRRSTTAFAPVFLNSLPVQSRSLTRVSG